MSTFENLKLAFVEDNEDTRLVITYLLKKRGIDVCQFADGESAAIGIPTFRPDVAIIDLGLPGKTGYEVAEEIRRNEDLNSYRPDRSVWLRAGSGSAQIDGGRV